VDTLQKGGYGGVHPLEVHEKPTPLLKEFVIQGSCVFPFISNSCQHAFCFIPLVLSCTNGNLLIGYPRQNSSPCPRLLTWWPSLPRGILYAQIAETGCSLMRNGETMIFTMPHGPEIIHNCRCGTCHKAIISYAMHPWFQWIVQRITWKIQPHLLPLQSVGFGPSTTVGYLISKMGSFYGHVR
jgi:hypothetical protein